MNYENCKICSGENEYVFENLILNKYNGTYVVCKVCGFLSVTNHNWQDEAYKNAIVDFDTGILERNIAATKKISFLFSIIFNQLGSYIDIAGGYGVFTRLMRDNGFNYYWNDEYCKNILAICSHCVGYRNWQPWTELPRVRLASFVTRAIVF